MASRVSPTVLKLRLGVELRRLRQDTSLTCAQVASKLKKVAAGTNWSETKISRIETAKLSVHPGDIEELLRFYQVPEGQHDALMSLARNARQRAWWYSYGDVLPDWFTTLIDIESEASVIRTFQADLVPGLLQTEGYAHAVIASTADPVSLLEIERRVKARIARQEILTLETPPRYSVVLDESALHRQVGGKEILRGQLQHLVQLAQLPNVTLRILPFSAGEFAGAGFGSFVILEFEDAGLPQIVYVDHLVGADYLDRDREVRAYASSFEQLSTVALSRQHSLKLIQELAEQA